MKFKAHIKLLADCVSKIKNNLLTEEATKTAIIMPFIQTMGYNVFNLTEIVPDLLLILILRKEKKLMMLFER